MQKVIWSNHDIIQEFITGCHMRGISSYLINQIIPLIKQENFQLIQTKKYLGTKRIVVYMCEWIEEGTKDSDEWLLGPDRFIGSIALNYIIEAKKLKYKPPET